MMILPRLAHGTRRAAVALAGLLCITSLSAQGSLPRAGLTHFKYLGSFKAPFGRYGNGRIAFNPNGNGGQGSLFLDGGGSNAFSIGEINIPALTPSTGRDQLAQLPTATVLQNRSDIYARIPQRAASWPEGTVNSFSNGNNAVFGGLYYEGGKLYFNAYTYYGSTSETATTGRIENPASLATTTITGMFHTQGAARTAGWMMPIPTDWRARLGGTHLVGHDNGITRLERTSAGPTLYAFNLADMASAASGAAISTAVRLNFPDVAGPRAIWGNDMTNVSGQNKMWTLMTKAGVGFIIPGTRTYALLGMTAGCNPNPANPWQGTPEEAFAPPIAGTIAYKRTDSLGYSHGGPMVWDAQDQHTFFALFDLDEILAAPNTWTPRPYEYGHFPTPFARYGNYTTPGQISDTIGGGAWDPATRRLYVTLPAADNDSDALYSGIPVIAVYELTVGGQSLTVTSPNGGEAWRRGESRLITWTDAGITESLMLELMQGPTLLGVIATGIAPDGGSYAWTVGRLADGSTRTGTNLRLRIRTASGRVVAEAHLGR